MIEHNLKPTNTRIITADAPDADHYSFKEWTGDIDHISVGTAQSNPATITMPNHSVVLNSTYNPYRVLTVNQGDIIPGLFTPISYGRLYNWYAASNVNFAPAGWHVSTQAEVTTLLNYLGGNTISGGKLKEIGEIYWTTNIGATNETGFNARGSSWRAYTGTFQSSLKIIFNMLTSTANGVDNMMSWAINNSSAGLINEGGNRKGSGMSCRLVKNDSTDSRFVTDYDGNIYSTVKIGSQVWTAMNWKCTHLNNGTLIPIVTDNTAWAALTTAAMCSYNNDDSNI